VTARARRLAGRVCKPRVRCQQVGTPGHRQLQVDRAIRRQTVRVRCHQERADIGSLRVQFDRQAVCERGGLLRLRHGESHASYSDRERIGHLGAKQDLPDQRRIGAPDDGVLDQRCGRTVVQKPGDQGGRVDDHRRHALPYSIHERISVWLARTFWRSDLAPATISSTESCVAIGVAGTSRAIGSPRRVITNDSLSATRSGNSDR
jgi:hypothetical protein